MSVNGDWQQRVQAHWHRLRLVGFLLVGLLLLLVFPFPFHGRLWRAIFDLAHAPAFFVAALLSVFALDPGKLGISDAETLIPLTRFRFLGLAIILVALGFLGELGQAFVGRHASLQDAAANAAGVLAGAMTCVAASQPSVLWKLLLAIPPIVVLLLSEIRPLAEIQEHFRQISQWPLIASFERPEELRAWEPHGATMVRSEEWSIDGKWSLRVRSVNGQIYPGASMLDFPGNWSGYDSLEMTVRNRASLSMLLGVRIVDRLHEERGYIAEDRFQVYVPLEPGEEKALRWQLQEVRRAPAEREADLSDLTQVDVFSAEPQSSVDFEVDGIRLHQTRN